MGIASAAVGVLASSLTDSRSLVRSEQSSLLLLPSSNGLIGSRGGADAMVGDATSTSIVSQSLCAKAMFDDSLEKITKDFYGLVDNHGVNIDL